MSVAVIVLFRELLLNARTEKPVGFRAEIPKKKAGNGGLYFDSARNVVASLWFDYAGSAALIS
jgi:hypothetical protein